MLRNKIVIIFNKYKEVILYLIFGVLTTAVNILIYALFARIISLNIFFANVIAWILSVLFAYLTNRKYVFKSKNQGKLKEVISFYICRLLTFAFDMLLMYILIFIMTLDDMISKILVNVIVIILNYIFSKSVVFNQEVKK